MLYRGVGDGGVEEVKVEDEAKEKKVGFKRMLTFSGVDTSDLGSGKGWRK